MDFSEAYSNNVSKNICMTFVVCTRVEVSKFNRFVWEKGS